MGDSNPAVIVGRTVDSFEVTDTTVVMHFTDGAEITVTAWVPDVGVYVEITSPDQS